MSRARLRALAIVTGSALVCGALAAGCLDLDGLAAGPAAADGGVAGDGATEGGSGGARPCDVGQCVPERLASGLEHGWYVAVHPTAGAYFGESRPGGRIFHLPVGAPSAEEVASPNGAFDLDADDEGVVFTSGERSTFVRAIAKGSRTVTTVADLGHPGGKLLELEREGQDVWVTAQYDDAEPDSRGRLFHVVGSVVQPVATARSLEGLVVDETEVFVTDPSSELVRVYVRNGTTLKRTMPTGTVFPRRMAADAENLYIISHGDPRIVRMKKSNGDLTTLAIDADRCDIGSITVDETYVYWANPLKGTIKRVRKAGDGTAETMASNLGKPVGIAQDARFLYFTVYGEVGAFDGYIARLPK